MWLEQEKAPGDTPVYLSNLLFNSFTGISPSYPLLRPHWSSRAFPGCSMCVLTSVCVSLSALDVLSPRLLCGACFSEVIPLECMCSSDWEPFLPGGTGLIFDPMWPFPSLNYDSYHVL